MKLLIMLMGVGGILLMCLAVLMRDKRDMEQLGTVGIFLTLGSIVLTITYCMLWIWF